MSNSLESPAEDSAILTRVPLVTHSQARSMAESMWGPGGTTAYRTNRTGAFYFSCSGHGGFVIDDRTLTEHERARLTEAGFAADKCWGARGADGRILSIRHPHSEVVHPRKLTYRPGLGEYVDRDIPVWTFEEDTEWAAVYTLTGIRAPGSSPWPEARMMTYAREVLGRWHPKAAQVAARAAIGDDASPAAGELRHFRDTSALYADHSTWYTIHSQAAYEGMIRASREHGNQVAAGEKFDLSRLPAEARALHAHALACGWDTSIHEKEVTASGRPARGHALSFWRGQGDDTERIYRAWVDGRHHDDGSPPIAELMEVMSSPRVHATRPAKQAAAGEAIEGTEAPRTLHTLPADGFPQDLPRGPRPGASAGTSSGKSASRSQPGQSSRATRGWGRS